MSRPAELLPVEGLTIAAVERDTGLPKDTLRVWERRYGFPTPRRDAFGERRYAAEQVDKLRLLKRLLDAGHRPGRVIAKPNDELRTLLEPAGAESAPAVPPAEPVAPIVRAIAQHDHVGLRRLLTQAIGRVGVVRFLEDVVMPVGVAVGDAWMRGEMRVHQEHLFSEAVQALLRRTLASMPAPTLAARPRVLLATLPGEQHGLGLLAAETVMTLEGCDCIVLGVQTPVDDLVHAAQAHAVDVVALSLGPCTNPARTLEWLRELRQRLEPTAALWIGGRAPMQQRRPLPGIVRLASVGDIAQAVGRWRALGAPLAPGPASTLA